MPLLWRDRVIGWSNLTVSEGVLHSQLHYVDGRSPRGAHCDDALDPELVRIRKF